MNNFPILSLLTFLPLIGAIFIITIRGDEKVVNRNSQQVALWTSIINFLLSLFIWFHFDPNTSDYQFVEFKFWMPSLNINYKLGVDGISILFVLLTTLLTPICILASWENIQVRLKDYMIAFLVLETFMIGMFCAMDMLVFYLFFEAVLIPMFLIIGIWGGPRRVYASFKFFLYTLAGSVLMLIAIIAMYFDAGTTDIISLKSHTFPVNLQVWLWLAFFASFAVKIPMWPVHTWLPDAHVEAPTAGSVILAAVLLKFGGYGLLRFSLPLFPEASVIFTPLVYTLSVVAIIYTSLVALVQEDMKKLIAYSSIAHMGFVTIGAFTLTVQGIEGSIYQMLAHGVISAALFLVVGVVYDRIHSREISAYGGLAHKMPAYSLIFMLFMFASVGLPGTAGFVGELLILIGIFQVNILVAVMAATGLILGAAYMLYLYRRVIFGAFKKKNLAAISDMTHREKIIFAPLVILVIWMGVYPAPFLDVLHVSVENMINEINIALDEGQTFSMAKQ